MSQEQLGRDSKDELADHTVRLGFNNVIDAFHVIGRDEIPLRFYVDERDKQKGIRITEEFSRLSTGGQFPNLCGEVESRWRLVETAWEIGISRSVVTIGHDPATEELFTIDSSRRRRSVTASRSALNGYQKGKCFYCFGGITLAGAAPSDVDHFFPHILKTAGFGPLIDGVWNLVLACRECNRGARGKWYRVPSVRLLERLSRRNEYLIESHHPLRETLIVQTGATVAGRRSFLNDFHREAATSLLQQWEPAEMAEHSFL